MDAACRVQNETVRPHGPENFARGEKSAKNGRGNSEKYDRGDATELLQHERREKSLDAGNLGNVPDKAQSPKRENESFWTAKDTYYQRVAISGREPEKRPNSGGYFAGIGKYALI